MEWKENVEGMRARSNWKFEYVGGTDLSDGEISEQGKQTSGMTNVR